MIDVKNHRHYELLVTNTHSRGTKRSEFTLNEFFNNKRTFTRTFYFMGFRVALKRDMDENWLHLSNYLFEDWLSNKDDIKTKDPELYNIIVGNFLKEVRVEDYV